MDEYKFEPVSGSEPQINEELFYFVDFSTMEKVEDLILVLASMGFGISNKNPYFEQIKPFLKIDQPMPIPPR